MKLCLYGDALKGGGEESGAGSCMYGAWFGRFNIQKEVELWDRDAILGQARR
jgi:hypothetical protein